MTVKHRLSRMNELCEVEDKTRQDKKTRQEDKTPQCTIATKPTRPIELNGFDLNLDQKAHSLYTCPCNVKGSGLSTFFSVILSHYPNMAQTIKSYGLELKSDSLLNYPLDFTLFRTFYFIKTQYTFISHLLKQEYIISIFNYILICLSNCDSSTETFQ
ncbi:hypothetical protein BLOT_014319 [Blomia tropicalis]|nr:hypothetical protein BLOT_014319 [Blomia tropicalis]